MIVNSSVMTLAPALIFTGSGAFANIQMVLINSPASFGSSYIISIPAAASVANVSLILVNSVISTGWGLGLIFQVAGPLANIQVYLTNSSVSVGYALFYASGATSATNMSIVLVSGSSVYVSGSYTSSSSYCGILLQCPVTNFLFIVDRSNFSVPSSFVLRIQSGTSHKNISVLASAAYLVSSASYTLFQIDSMTSLVGLTLSLNNVKCSALVHLIELTTLSGSVNSTTITITSTSVPCSDTNGCLYLTNSGSSLVVVDTTSISIVDSIMQGVNFVTLNVLTNFVYVVLRSTINSAGGMAFYAPTTGLVRNVSLSYISSNMNVRHLSRFGSVTTADTVSLAVINTTVIATGSLAEFNTGSLSRFTFAATNSTFTVPFGFYFTGAGAFANIQISFLNSPTATANSLFHGINSASATNVSISLVNSSVTVTSSANYGIGVAGSVSNFLLLVQGSNFTTSNIMLSIQYSTLNSNVSIVVSSAWLTCSAPKLFEFFTFTSMTGMTLSLTKAVVAAVRLLDFNYVSRFLNGTVLLITNSTVTCSDSQSCVWQSLASGGSLVHDTTTIAIADSTLTKGFDFDSSSVLTNFAFSFVRSSMTISGGWGLYVPANTGLVRNVTAAYINCSTLNVYTLGHFGSPTTVDTLSITVLNSNVVGASAIAEIDTGSI